MAVDHERMRKKKLIELALPLDDINAAAAKEKSIRHGHPSTLHLWWARRPLAACRAVLFASLVDDPSSDPKLSETEAEVEREKLFDIIRELVIWENSNNPEVLAKARAAILKSTGGNPPPVLDPFCGGGSIPLEAQRLGLEAHGSDLNPVAVLITKALIEIPPRFAGRPPVNPEHRRGTAKGFSYHGAEGLAEDVRYYGKWMRDEAQRRIGHLYPKAKLPGGGEATVIAWLWARTVRCPNPACGAEMPLVRSFALSTKKGKETWVEPIVEPGVKYVRFEVQTGTPENPGAVAAGTGFIGERGKKTQATFLCPVCNAGVAKGDYIDAEANEGRIGAMPLAKVVERRGGRLYLPFTEDEAQEQRGKLSSYIADPEFQAKLPSQQCRGTFASNAQGRRYGFAVFSDYFTSRQLVALMTFSDLVSEAREQVLIDGRAAGLTDDPTPLHKGGSGAIAYAQAVAIYLAFSVDKLVDYNSSVCSWHSLREIIRNTFARQAISMVWDFAEANPFSGGSGNFLDAVGWVAKVVSQVPGFPAGLAAQNSAAMAQVGIEGTVCVSTDPPYYDNIGYADLSDFFYVWLRRSLDDLFPDLFRTLLVPKSDELIASPYRHEGSKAKAQRFFEEGLFRAFEAMKQAQNPGYPMTVYYAFKQAEDDRSNGNDGGVASTGWATMLEGLLSSGFAITGTWPMRTELGNRMIGRGTNALASSIVIVCRPREATAGLATRRDFTNALRLELPDALIALQHGNIAPVDFEQAAIGPGMAIFTRYAKVVEADGAPMRVRTALQLINQEKDAYLESQDGNLDADTNFCIVWYDQYGYSSAPFGKADDLARAKNTSFDGLRRAGVLTSEAGKVRLLSRAELADDWDPQTDSRLTIWEATQHLIRRFEDKERGGAQAAGALLAALGSERGEAARALAYRLFTLCERRNRADEALAYNGLITAWPDIQRAASDIASTRYRQEQLTH